MIDEIKHKIEVSRELLDTLPKNNIKNQKEYNEKLNEQIEQFEKYKFKINNEIVRRIKKYEQLYEEFDDKTSEISDKIKQVNGYLYLLNEYNSSYEKLNFDKILYKLNHFYKEELDEVNDNILECIEIFKKAGITLTNEDFNYSEYTTKYMKALLENKENIKNTFEEIYWQCPDLFIHIELNIKYLYFLNKKTFDRYVEVLKNNFINTIPNVDPLEYYKSLVVDYDNKVSTSLKRGLIKFMKKEMNINDYKESNIQKCYSFFTDEPYDNELVKEIIKMAHSVEEYKEYIYFKDLIENIKKEYANKNSYKGNLKRKLKLIHKKEKLVKRYNKKKSNKLFDLMKELDDLYSELNLDLFFESLYNNINDDSTIYDILYLASSYFTYIVKHFTDVNKVEEFISIQNRLNEFVVNPYNTIFKNIKITDDRNIPFIICDRYKLSNINIDSEMLEEKADEIISNAKILEIYYKTVSIISYNRIEFMVNSHELLNK